MSGSSQSPNTSANGYSPDGYNIKCRVGLIIPLPGRRVFLRHTLDSAPGAKLRTPVMSEKKPHTAESLYAFVTRKAVVMSPLEVEKFVRLILGGSHIFTSVHTEYQLQKDHAKLLQVFNRLKDEQLDRAVARSKEMESAFLYARIRPKWKLAAKKTPLWKRIYRESKKGGGTKSIRKLANENGMSESGVRGIINRMHARKLKKRAISDNAALL
jgi:hypothetical protein